MIDFGYLIGVIDVSRKISSVLSGDSMVVQIGKRQELNCLSALRAGSLDCMLVLWNYLDC